MTQEKKYYYKVYLQVSLRSEETVTGSINISHIPYSKLEEIFKDEIMEDQRFLFDHAIVYMIDEQLYNKHKDFLDKEISFKFKFDLFEYAVMLTEVKVENYKKDYHEDLPPFFTAS